MEVRHIKNIILMIMKKLGLADLLPPPFPAPLTFSVYLRLSHNMDQHFVVDSTRFLFTTLSLCQYLYGFVLLCASPFFLWLKLNNNRSNYYKSFHLARICIIFRLILLAIYMRGRRVTRAF